MTLPPELNQGFSRAAVEALSAYKKEPGWMTDLRVDAWRAYEKAPFSPSEISLTEIRPFTAPPTMPVPSREWPRTLQQAIDERGDEEGLIVQRDSTVLSRSITKEHSKKGVIFTDLDTALQNCPDLVRKFYGRQVGLETPATCLNAAFWTGGTFLYIPDHVGVPLPFHTCLWMSSPEAGIFSRALVVVEGGSQVSFIDECVSVDWDRPSLAVEVLEAFIGPKTRVNCFHLHHAGRGVRHYREEKSQVSPSGYLHMGQLQQRPNALLERAAELYPEVRI